VGIASTGPGIKSLREWNREQGYLHAIVEMPQQLRKKAARPL
jgi:hypothetical protein